MITTFEARGTCTREIRVDAEDGVVKSVQFIGGCDGNLQGISRLVEGMEVSKVIELLKGIRCGRKPTSCPDQLAAALGALDKTPAII
ncbi:MAG: TIGR03905 family TSCPD domain-containing protein [Oscillospiraceae bacterium]|nr:TIGR03905 family TSCPD domain-containing protein [Oscillospiraceae bacterium]